MGLSTSFSIGITGLNSNENTLGVIGDNIANVQTAGFKQQRVRFADMVAGFNDVNSRGLGSRVAGVSSMFQQAAIEQTGVATDMAINGNGFFIVDSVHGPMYTRNGQFAVDNEGNLTDAVGRRVQGFMANDKGIISPSSVLGDLKVDGYTLPASATEEADIGINLDASVPVGPGFDLLDPAGTSDASHGITLYDSLGTAHQATVYYSKTAPNSWEYSVVVDGAELSGGTEGVNQEIAHGALTFNAEGKLSNVHQEFSSADFAGGATPGQSVKFKFGDAINDGGTGLTGTTQFAGPNTITKLSQDGMAPGSLTDFTVSSDGVLTGVFSNGGVRALGRLALARFANEEGLQRVGGNAFQATGNSGEALIGDANTGGRGQIMGQSIETSGVDLSKALVEMITTQRAFQTNARTINVASENLLTLIGLGQ